MFHDWTDSGERLRHYYFRLSPTYKSTRLGLSLTTFESPQSRLYEHWTFLGRSRNDRDVRQRVRAEIEKYLSVRLPLTPPAT